MNRISDKTLGLVQVALLGAIIFIMAFTPFIGYIPIGITSATIIHIPVIIGSILLGPRKGAILGFLFGLTSLILSTTNPSATSFVFSPFYVVEGVNSGARSLLSIVICFVPRILIGIVPYYVYKFLHLLMHGKKGSDAFSLTIAGLCGSLTNTLLVMHMIYLFFGNAYASANGVSTGALYGLILGIIGINGVPEAIIAAILTCTICKAIRSIRK